MHDKADDLLWGSVDDETIHKADKVVMEVMLESIYKTFVKLGLLEEEAATLVGQMYSVFTMWLGAGDKVHKEDTARVCIEIIQKGIIRDGDTPENQRSYTHISNIKAAFKLE